MVPLFEKLKIVGNAIGYVDTMMNLYLPLGCMIFFLLGHYLYNTLISSGRIDVNKMGIVMAFVVIERLARRSIVRFFDIKNSPIDWIIGFSKYPYVVIDALVYSIIVFLFLGAVVSQISIHSLKVRNMIHHMGKNSNAVYVFHIPLKSIFERLNIQPSLGHGMIGIPIEITAIFLIGWGLSLL